MSFDHYVLLAKKYAMERYAWDDLDRAALWLYYDGGCTVRHAVDQEAESFDLVTLHDHLDAGWGRPDTFDFTPYEVTK